MNEFMEGFKKGWRETPRGYFAPLVVLVHWLASIARRLFLITDRAVKQQNADESVRPNRR